MATAVAKTDKTKSKSVALVEMIEGRKSDIEAVLSPGVKVDAFIRVIKNAFIRDPKIAEADQQSVFLECQKAAQDGLVLDGREAVLTRFNTKVKIDGKDTWVTKVTYIPMVYGVMKRVRNTGRVSSWNVGVVYEQELADGRFKYLAGDAPRIEHEPIIFGERGDMVAVYSSVKLSDGTFHHDVMSREDVDRIMGRTKSRDRDGNVTGPWKTDYIEMAKKTIIRRHSKRLPMSGEDISVIERIDALYDFKKDGDVYRDPGPHQPQSVRNKTKTSAAERLGQGPHGSDDAEDDTPDHDKETGEVIEAEVVDGDAGEPEDNGDLSAEDQF